MEECMFFFLEQTTADELSPCNMGSVVGTHVGPGAAGLAYFVKA